MKHLHQYIAVAVAGATSGIGAASINIAARFADKASDILGFAGSAIGAGAAVCGALFIERYKENKTRRISRYFVGGTVLSLASGAVATMYQRGPALLAGLATIEHAYLATEFALSKLPAEDFAVHIRIANFRKFQTTTNERLAKLIDQYKDAEFKDDTLLRPILRELSETVGHVRFLVADKEYWPRDITAGIIRYEAEASILMATDGAEDQSPAAAV